MKTWFKKEEDERVTFANYACKLLVEKHNGDIEKAVKNLLELKVYFQNNVRNIYQFTRCNIPLFSLYEYDEDKEDYEWFLEDRGYDIETARETIIQACKDYYLTN